MNDNDKASQAFEVWLQTFGFRDALLRDFPPTTIGYQWFVAAFEGGVASVAQDRGGVLDEAIAAIQVMQYRENERELDNDEQMIEDALRAAVGVVLALKRQPKEEGERG